jgi:hypothetical protein
MTSRQTRIRITILAALLSLASPLRAAQNQAPLELSELFTASLTAPGFVLGPESVFLSPKRNETLVVASGIGNGAEGNAVWLLWRHSSGGERLGQAEISRRNLKQEVRVLGCVLTLEGRALCLAEKQDVLNLVIVPFDGPPVLIPTSTRAPATTLGRFLAVGDGRYLGLGSQAGEPYAVMFSEPARLDWAQRLGEARRGSVVDAVEEQTGDIALSAVTYRSTGSRTIGIPCLFYVSRAGNVRAEQCYESSSGTTLLLSSTARGLSEGGTQAAPADVLARLKKFPVPLAVPQMPEPQAGISSNMAAVLKAHGLYTELKILDDRGGEPASRFFPDLIYSFGTLLASDQNRIVLLAPERPSKTEQGIQRDLRLVELRLMQGEMR